MGDFTGFTFGDWHSTNPDTGLVTVLRTSGGDRYQEELQPEIKDITAEVPGLNGEYFFGSNYGPKKIDIEIAFDSLTEEQFRQMRGAFGTKNIKQLIFDERPYKKYMAKIESPVEFSYVCFDEPKKVVGAERDGVRVILRTTTSASVDEAMVGYSEVDNTTPEPIIVREKVTPYVTIEGQYERIYKGEGKVSFICYFPFAKSAYKVLPDESEEWAISSGLLTETVRNTAKIDEYDNGQIVIYNAGDLPNGFRLYIPSSELAAKTISYMEDITASTPSAILKLKKITLKDGDIGVLIDTNNQVIVGVTTINSDISGNGIYTTSGNLYNEYIDSGYFFHLEPNIAGSYSKILIADEVTDETQTESENNEIESNENESTVGIEIYYDYLYF